jgi:hypothetical protein
MLRLLLERASAFCAARSIRDYREMRSMRIELGARGGVSLPRIKVYLWDKLQRQSQAGTTFLKRGSIDWSVMDREQIEIFQAHKRAGIQLADVVASAIRQAVDLKPDGTLIAEYADILRPVVAATKRGIVADHGFKLMPDPPSLWKIGLSDQQVRTFESFGYGRRYLVGPDP